MSLLSMSEYKDWRYAFLFAGSLTTSGNPPVDIYSSSFFFKSPRSFVDNKFAFFTATPWYFMNSLKENGKSLRGIFLPVRCVDNSLLKRCALLPVTMSLNPCLCSLKNNSQPAMRSEEH